MLAKHSENNYPLSGLNIEIIISLLSINIKSRPVIGTQFRCLYFQTKIAFQKPICATALIQRNKLLTFVFDLIIWFSCSIFFHCFSMNYRVFSLKSKPIISLFQIMKIMTFGFWDYFFLLYFMNYLLKVLPKRFKCSILV